MAIRERRRAASLGALGLAGLLFTSGCAVGAEEAPAAPASGESTDALADMEPITIIHNELVPESGLNAVEMKAFAAEVTERTNGKVQWEFYWGSSLLPGTEALQGVGSGVAGTSLVVPSYFPQDLPVSNAANPLFSTLSRSYPHGVMQGMAAGHELFQSPNIAEEWAAHNTKVLAVNVTSAYQAICTKPLETVVDAAGLRVRTAGELLNQEAEELGMIPTTLNATEMYEGLQRGVIDCVSLVPNSMEDWGLWEVADYFSPVAMSPLPAVLAINLDVWKSLPEEAQQIFVEAAGAYMQAGIEFDVDRMSKLFEPEGQASVNDVTLQDPTEINEVLLDFQEERAKSVADTVAAAGVEDPDALVATFDDAAERWLAQITDEMDLPESDGPANEAYASAASVDIGAYVDALRQAGVFDGE